jgi:hypothetical protein
MDVVLGGKLFEYDPKSPMVCLGVLFAAVRVDGADMKLHLAGFSDNVDKKNWK